MKVEQVFKITIILAIGSKWKLLLAYYKDRKKGRSGLVKKCMLVSFFNSSNIGDVLIAEELRKLITNAGYDVIRCSYEGGFVIKGYGNMQKRKGISPNKLIKTLTRINIIGRLRIKLRKSAFWMKFKREVKKCDFLVIGGGNMIFDLLSKSKSAAHFKRYVDIVKKQQKKVVVLSVGIGPFQTPNQRKMAIEALDRCDYITFRDAESFNLITENNFEDGKYFLSVDPVFMLPSIETGARKKKGDAVGIGVINTLLFNPEQSYYETVLSGYVQLINQLIAEGREVFVFSTERNDYCMVDDIVATCNNIKVTRIDVNTNRDLIELFSTKISLLIAARMHSLIVAYTQLTPVIGLSWQQKVNAFFGIIRENESVFPIDNMSEYQEQILTSVHEKERDLDDYRCKAKEKLEEIRRQYNINKKIVSESFWNS